MPTLIRVPLSTLVGEAWADMIIKNMMMTLSFIIQFPINKWVIMRNKPTSTPLTFETLPT